MSSFEYANAPESKAIANIATPMVYSLVESLLNLRRVKVLTQLTQQLKKSFQKLDMPIN